MKVLLSIKPEYAEKILSGEKRFEFRKALFKNKEVKTIVIYATMPVGKVVGEFEFDGVVTGTPDAVWSQTEDYSGVSQNFFKEYFNGREMAHAIKVGNVKRYLEPLNLTTLVPNGLAPQSYLYII